jgi:hypothetical protein
MVHYENPRWRESFCEKAENANFGELFWIFIQMEKSLEKKIEGIRTSRVVRFEVRTT